MSICNGFTDRYRSARLSDEQKQTVSKLTTSTFENLKAVETIINSCTSGKSIGAKGKKLITKMSGTQNQSVRTYLENAQRPSRVAGSNE